MLYRSTDRLCRRGAAVENLAHSASFHSMEYNAPSKPGIKHLAADGENATKAGDVDELRTIVLRLWDNQITMENISGDIRKLASVLRG
jgi:hypothetical protein